MIKAAAGMVVAQCVGHRSGCMVLGVFREHSEEQRCEERAMVIICYLPNKAFGSDERNFRAILVRVRETCASATLTTRINV